MTARAVSKHRRVCGQNYGQIPVLAQKKSPVTGMVTGLFTGAVGGIRTLVPLLTTTRFPVVLVMTSSIPLHIHFLLTDSVDYYTKISTDVKTFFRLYLAFTYIYAWKIANPHAPLLPGMTGTGLSMRCGARAVCPRPARETRLLFSDFQCFFLMPPSALPCDQRKASGKRRAEAKSP